MRYLLALTLLLSCATADPKPVPALTCPTCPSCAPMCEQCAKVCGASGVRRCETYGGAEKMCECKGY